MDETSSRPGRWRTGEQSRARILRAARDCFGARGYDRTTIRTIAAEAGVDPSMVHYFFGTKASLFSAAMELPADVPQRIDDAVDEGVDGLGERLARHFVGVWDDQRQFQPLLALMRSAPTDDRSARMFQEFVEREIIGRLREAIIAAGDADADDADLRAELIGSQLIGLALARYVIRLEPLASASPDLIAHWIGPTLQRYIAVAGVDGRSGGR